MSQSELLAALSDEELVAEAKRRGYRMFCETRIYLLPCTCGAKKPREWFNVKCDGWIQKCEMCGLRAPAAKTKKAAKIAWNEMIEAKRREEQ